MSKKFTQSLEAGLMILPADLKLTILLIKNWNEIAGKHAQHTRPMKIYIKQKMLMISANAGASMNMQYYHDELVENVNKFLKKTTIKKIVIKNQLNDLE